MNRPDLDARKCCNQSLVRAFSPKLPPHLPMPYSIRQPVADHSVDAVITRTETPQLHFFSVLDLLRITVPPLDRHVRVSIGIYQDINCAIPIQHWKERH